MLAKRRCFSFRLGLERTKKAIVDPTAWREFRRLRYWELAGRRKPPERIIIGCIDYLLRRRGIGVYQVGVLQDPASDAPDGRCMHVSLEWLRIVSTTNVLSLAIQRQSSWRLYKVRPANGGRVSREAPCRSQADDKYFTCPPAINELVSFSFCTSISRRLQTPLRLA